MDKNRIEEFFRDPTLEQPTGHFFTVGIDCEEIRVSPETAARILAALGGPAPRFLRVETITGSVAYVRTDRIVSLLESTPAQRAAMRRMWKLLREEREEDDDDSFES